jgi:small nuclear ribonucleoprotein (snRNP)-like protein
VELSLWGRDMLIVSAAIERDCVQSHEETSNVAIIILQQGHSSVSLLASTPLGHDLLDAAAGLHDGAAPVHVELLAGLGVDDDEGGDASHAEGLAQSADVGTGEGNGSPRHVSVVSIEGGLVAVTADEDDLEVLGLLLEGLVELAEHGRESPAGRTLRIDRLEEDGRRDGTGTYPMGGEVDAEVLGLGQRLAGALGPGLGQQALSAVRNSPVRHVRGVEQDIDMRSRTHGAARSGARTRGPWDFGLGVSCVPPDLPDSKHEHPKIESVITTRDFTLSMGSLDILSGYLSSRIRLLLTDGRLIEGEFQCMDSDMNFVLGDAVEYHNVSLEEGILEYLCSRMSLFI